MLSHTLAKMLLQMDDVPVVVGVTGAELREIGGAHDIQARRHFEYPDTYYMGLWFRSGKDRVPQPAKYFKTKGKGKPRTEAPDPNPDRKVIELR